MEKYQIKKAGNNIKTPILEYIVENIKNNVKVAKPLYSVKQKNGCYKVHKELVKINGIVFDKGLYWLILDDGSKYLFNLITEDLKNGYKLEELLTMAV